MGSDRGGVTDSIVVVVALVVLNVVTVRLLNGAATAVTLVVASVVAVLIARRRGYSLDELALSPATVSAGLRLGAAISAVVVLVVVAIALVPFSRSFLDDDRFLDLSTARVIYEVAVRIPIATALTEEILFRSVLLAALMRATTRLRAVWLSALCFGLWHVLVTFEDLAGNAASDSLDTWGKIGGVAGVVVATGIAGVLFAWSRLRSASIVAPWLVHTVINAATFLAGYLVAVR